MVFRAWCIVSFLAAICAAPAHSQFSQREELGYERVGTIEHIDRAGRIVRIDGHSYILPADLVADPNVEYRVGDEVGYSVSPPGPKASSATLKTMILVTH